MPRSFAMLLIACLCHKLVQQSLTALEVMCSYLSVPQESWVMEVQATRYCLLLAHLLAWAL